MAAAASAGTMPSRAWARASAASTSSMDCRKRVSLITARIASVPYSTPRTGESAGFTVMAVIR